MQADERFLATTATNDKTKKAKERYAPINRSRVNHRSHTQAIGAWLETEKADGESMHAAVHMLISIQKRVIGARLLASQQVSVTIDS